MFQLFCFSITCCADLCESILEGQVAVLKSGIFQILKKRTRILRSSGFCHFYQIFENNFLFLVPLKANQSVSLFLDQDIFFVYIRLGLVILLQGVQICNPNMKHTHTQILTVIQPPIAQLDVISGFRQTWLGILKGKTKKKHSWSAFWCQNRQNRRPLPAT